MLFTGLLVDQDDVDTGRRDGVYVGVLTVYTEVNHRGGGHHCLVKSKLSDEKNNPFDISPNNFNIS